MVGMGVVVTVEVNVTVVTELNISAPALVLKMAQSAPGHEPTKLGAPVMGPTLLASANPLSAELVMSIMSPSLKWASPMVPCRSLKIACVSFRVPLGKPAMENTVGVPCGVSIVKQQEGLIRRVVSVVSVKLNAAFVNAVPPKLPLPVPVIVNVSGAAVPTTASKNAQPTLRKGRLR